MMRSCRSKERIGHWLPVGSLALVLPAGGKKLNKQTLFLKVSEMK
jgi:hypothetical protein